MKHKITKRKDMKRLGYKAPGNNNYDGTVHIIRLEFVLHLPSGKYEFHSCPTYKLHDAY